MNLREARLCNERIIDAQSCHPEAGQPADRQHFATWQWLVDETLPLRQLSGA
jgi:hypothetical protein